MLDPEQQYVIFRSDRSDRIGGGSCAFISRDLHCYRIEIPSDVEEDLKTCGCDILCFNIIMHSTKYRFILIYRPPNSSLKTDLSQKTLSLLKVINRLSDLQTTSFVLGDMNFPGINWINSTFKTNGVDDLFFNDMSSLGMSQFVCEPTRVSKN